MEPLSLFRSIRQIFRSLLQRKETNRPAFCRLYLGIGLVLSLFRQTSVEVA